MSVKAGWGRSPPSTCLGEGAPCSAGWGRDSHGLMGCLQSEHSPGSPSPSLEGRPGTGIHVCPPGSCLKKRAQVLGGTDGAGLGEPPDTRSASEAPAPGRSPTCRVLCGLRWKRGAGPGPARRSRGASDREKGGQTPSQRLQGPQEEKILTFLYRDVLKMAKNQKGKKKHLWKGE